MFTNAAIARICHEANRALCTATGDHSHWSWDHAEQWQRDSAISGVAWRRANPDAPDSVQHDQWMQEKLDAGWTCGTEKDAGKKTHPCLMPFEELPPEQRAKDALFKAIVMAFS